MVKFFDISRKANTSVIVQLQLIHLYFSLDNFMIVMLKMPKDDVINNSVLESALKRKRTVDDIGKEIFTGDFFLTIE